MEAQRDILLMVCSVLSVSVSGERIASYDEVIEYIQSCNEQQTEKF